MDLVKSPSELDKEEILNLIAANSPRITLIGKENSKGAVSSAWSRFKIVQVDGKPTNFVKCVNPNCGDVLSWKSYSTSSLLRHTCKIKKYSIQTKLDQFSKKVPASFSNDLNRQLLIALAVDQQPLATVERKGFKLAAQTLINFGATHGYQNVDDVILSRHTYKRNLSEIIEEKLPSLVEQIKTSVSYPSFGVTTDMWSDKYQHRTFLSVSIHFIDSSFDLQTRMLSVEEFPDEKKTAANIREEILRIFTRIFGDDAHHIMENSTAVTDGGSNLLSVFSHRLPCMAHRLNTCLTWIFNEKVPKSTASDSDETARKRSFVFSSSCPTANESLNSVKAVVTYFKRSGLNKKLQSKLKQDVPTRWNSKLLMVESYLKSVTEVKKILVEKNHLDKVYGIQEDMLRALVVFLKPFQECTKVWSSENKPTINEVAIWVNILKSHCTVKEEDLREIQILKEQALRCFNEYFALDDIYFVGCMLNPKYRKLKFLDPSDRDKVYDKFKELIRHTEVDSSPRHDMIETSEVSKPKRSKFADLEDSSDSETETAECSSEFDRYLKHRITKESEGETVLHFWKNATDFKSIRKVAARVLAVPASQTCDERVFSATGNTLTEKRTELKGSTLANLTFVHKNADLFM